MTTLGLTRFGISTKFADTNQNTVSKTYNGLNMTGNSADASIVSSFFVDGISTIGGQSAAMFDLLGDDYSVSVIDRNMNNEVVMS